MLLKCAPDDLSRCLCCGSGALLRLLSLHLTCRCTVSSALIPPVSPPCGSQPLPLVPREQLFHPRFHCHVVVLTHLEEVQCSACLFFLLSLIWFAFRYIPTEWILSLSFKGKEPEKNNGGDGDCVKGNCCFMLICTLN